MAGGGFGRGEIGAGEGVEGERGAPWVAVLRARAGGCAEGRRWGVCALCTATQEEAERARRRTRRGQSALALLRLSESSHGGPFSLRRLLQRILVYSVRWNGTPCTAAPRQGAVHFLLLLPPRCLVSLTPVELHRRNDSRSADRPPGARPGTLCARTTIAQTSGRIRPVRRDPFESRRVQEEESGSPPPLLLCVG